MLKYRRNSFFILLFIFFFQSFTYAQLADFSLDVIVSDETCDDNGALTFNVTNDTPGSTFLFTVYLLPDEVNPVAATNEIFVNNLNSGTYNIIAVQSFNGESNIQESTVVIEDVIEPLTYTISSFNQNCEVGGQIEINSVTGYPAEYEIISGPETRPLQTSNVFNDLPEGMYNIRVFDECGQGVVTTYTLILENAVPIVGEPEYEELINGNCDSVIVTNTISYVEGVSISYPLTVTYTIHPPNGDPDIVFTETYADGGSNTIDLVNEFNLYDGEQYTYDIVITNDCGVQYGNTGLIIDPFPSLTFQLQQQECGDYYIDLFAEQFTPPYLLDFTTAPDGFNPAAYNPDDPGPFVLDTVSYGNEENTLPEGIYEVTLTDACNRSTTIDFQITNDTPEPSVVGRNNGCYSEFGRIIVVVPDREIVSATIIAAPDAYNISLPQNVSSSIDNNGRLIVNNLPLGDYTLEIVDSCGEEYIIDANVPEFIAQDFFISALADCTFGVGSVEFFSGNGPLTDVILLDAPEDYAGTVPQDLSEDISSGVFFIDNLPEGEYTIQGIDICGIEAVKTVVVMGYVPDEDPFTFIPNCGSFDINMSDSSSGTGPATYWLQILIDEDNGIWGHPATNIIYPEGTIPDDNNSFELQNNTTIINLTFSGDFRIIKSFQSYGSGNSTKDCIYDLGTFVYLDDPRINGIYTLSCSENPDDIFVDALGIPELTYSIDQINGELLDTPIDNGDNPTFTGLPPASYRFVVEDGCGNISKITRDINVLPNLVTANQPANLFECTEPDNGETLFDFDLSQLNEIILGDQSIITHSVTYYLTETEAENGVNPIPETYATSDEVTTIFARVEHNFISICYEVISFQLLLGEIPTAELQEFFYVCENSIVTLSVGSGYDSYLWSNNATTESITVSEEGIYTVTITQGFCEATIEVIVVFSEPATITDVEISDWTSQDNEIVVNFTGEGSYEFSIDGFEYQESNVFTGLDPGFYTIYVRDLFGCGIVKEEVALLNYPKFFTPNGDGINEYWNIPYSWFESDFDVVVFDRYGKVITKFTSQDQGWDGTYNGTQLPSTDYWFLVTREDGRVHRGHFSMIR